MHSRHRSTGEPFSLAGGGYFGTSGRRSFGRRKFSSPKPPNHSNHQAPPTSPRKADVIFLEAGRLATEFLVSKGLIPVSLLPSQQRASALSRLRFDNIVAGEDRCKQFVKSHSRRRPYDRSYSVCRENGKDSLLYDDANEEDGEAAPGFSKSGTVEVVGESADDSASKVSSCSTRRDTKIETQIETEVNSIKNNHTEDNGENEGDTVRDLLQFLSASKVPTRPRSSPGQRNVKTLLEPSAEKKNNVSGDLHDSVGDETKAEDNNNNISVPDEQPMEQGLLEKQHESSELSPAVEEEENVASNSSSNEEKKENGFYMNNLGGEMSNGYDPQMIEEKPATIDSKLSNKIEVEDKRQPMNPSFKIIDLNLKECPEMNEMSEEASTIGDRKEQSSCFHNLSLVNSIDSAYKFRKLPGTQKDVPIIDLEDDSPGVALARSPMEPQNSSTYQDANPALSRTEHPLNLHSMQDNYGLIAPDLLGNDISGCSTVQPDLSNLQTGYGLPGAEVFPGDDIYESFGGLPMGFMEGWDPPQEYGNFL